jgi:hypothetical protein
LEIPTPPLTTTAPVEVLDVSSVDITLATPVTPNVPPMLVFFAMPTPPYTVTHPEFVLDESVVFVNNCFNEQNCIPDDIYIILRQNNTNDPINKQTFKRIHIS